jgi:hypothetical protein
MLFVVAVVLSRRGLIAALVTVPSGVVASVMCASDGLR